jgi:haloalkane dehalogenase
MVPYRRPDHPSVAGLDRSLAVARGFQGPAAIVWGERDPILALALHSVEEALPAARVTAVPAGHFLQEESPGAIADAIRDVATRAGLA